MGHVLDDFRPALHLTEEETGTEMGSGLLPAMAEPIPVQTNIPGLLGFRPNKLSSSATSTQLFILPHPVLLQLLCQGQGPLKTLEILSIVALKGAPSHTL